LKNLQALGLPPRCFPPEPLTYDTFPPDPLASGGWMLCTQTPSSKLWGFTKKAPQKNLVLFGKPAVQNARLCLQRNFFCIAILAGLHDHFNRGRLSIKAFFSQSKVIKANVKQEIITTCIISLNAKQR